MIDFFAAIIATGGVAKTLQIPGADLPGVHVLRTRQDAEAILGDIRKGGRAVILGGGFLGLEVASALRQLDMQVAVVSSEAVPMQKQFGERVARSLVRLHEAEGIQFHLDVSVGSLLGGDRVDAVILKDGSCLPADLVVIGVGVRPATEIVENAPLSDAGAIRVDAGMRFAPGVYAVGDIAAFSAIWLWPTRPCGALAHRATASPSCGTQCGGRACYLRRRAVLLDLPVRQAL